MSPAEPKLDDLRIKRPSRPEKNGRSQSIVITVIVLLATAGIIWLFMRPKPVELRTVVVREISSGGTDHTVLNASGYVIARRAATVSSKITGKVTEVYIEEGVKVTQGQILARLDDANVQASLQLSQAQLNSAKSALEEIRVRQREADREWDRQKSLVERGVTTQSDHDHAEASSLAQRARLAQQESDVTVAERTVAVWQQQVDDTIIRAPFAGIVTSKNAQPGEMISPMSSGGFTRTGICTIVDMESLEIQIDVNESYINRVAAGQAVEATLDAYPDWKIPCKVIAIIPTADRQKSTVQVRVGFDQLDPRILPEMAVKVAFRETATPNNASARRNVIVPRNAIRTVDGRDVVYVIQNGRAERRAVTVAGTKGEESEISAGLSAGEKVAAEPSASLADNTAVKEKNL